MCAIRLVMISASLPLEVFGQFLEKTTPSEPRNDCAAGDICLQLAVSGIMNTFGILPTYRNSVGSGIGRNEFTPGLLSTCRAVRFLIPWPLRCLQSNPAWTLRLAANKRVSSFGCGMSTIGQVHGSIREASFERFVYSAA